MKKILQQLFEHKTLTQQQAKDVLINISYGVYNDSEISSFTTVYLMRSITIEELQGFKEALMELCIPIDFGGEKILDIVGTGGDGKNTFNISTLSSFIVAGTGNKVAKHGNYSSTSVCGSGNVMEYLGYKFSNDNDVLKTQLEKANICYLHAPLFHPALKNVASIRKNLGVRTFFNMLGPLVNPADPVYQLTGVFSLEMARVYNYLLQRSSIKFAIIYSLDGYDEISLTGDTRITTNSGEKILSAEYLGKRMVSAEDIYGGNTIEENGKLFLKILKSEGSWAQNAVVIANAATALQLIYPEKHYDECYNDAVESLESGKALQSLKNLLSTQ